MVATALLKYYYKIIRHQNHGMEKKKNMVATIMHATVLL